MEAEKVKLLTFSEVGKMLGKSSMVIKCGILNGTLPIGFVGRNGSSTRDAGGVAPERLRKWLEGADLEVKH